MPIPFFPDGNQSSHSHSSHTPAQIPPQMAAFDWNHILQSPLDPAMFAALEAGGALGPLPKSPFGQANHLHQQQHNNLHHHSAAAAAAAAANSASANATANAAAAAAAAAANYFASLPSSAVSSLGSHSQLGPGACDSWSSSSPYSPPSHFLPGSQSTSPSQSPQSAGGALAFIKGKVQAHQSAAAAAAVAAAAAAQAYTQFADQKTAGASSATDDHHHHHHHHHSGSSSRRQSSEPKGFLNLHQATTNRQSIMSRRSGQGHPHAAFDGGGGGGTGGHLQLDMRLGMPPPPTSLHSSHLGANSPSPSYTRSSERTHHVNLPPSLWMSPLNPNPVVSSPTSASSSSHFPALSQLTMPSGPSIASYDHTAPSSASSSRPSSSPFVGGSLSTMPTSAATDIKSPTFYSDLLADDLFSPNRVSNLTPARTTGRGSPDLAAMASDLDPVDPEKMAEKDPLAAQVWKMYARTKASLPHAQRMENLTWRMMTLALKKRKEEESCISNNVVNIDSKEQQQNEAEKSALLMSPSTESKKKSATVTDDGGDDDDIRTESPAPSKEGETAAATAATTATTTTTSLTASSSSDELSKLLPEVKVDLETRGRRPDKTTARVRVVGFEGKNQDGDDNEYISFFFSLSILAVHKQC